MNRPLIRWRALAGLLALGSLLGSRSVSAQPTHSEGPRPMTDPAGASAPGASAEPASSKDESAVPDVVVRGVGWASPRGLGDTRVERALLEASPRQQTSEMLSAAPGFFVDHEDGEGLGNDVFLRGFDLDHGSGIEMRVGAIPINVPLHIQGQGYADANFIIPEVVRSVRVLEGPYDPRQGDAAIVGSAYFDLGVAERGYQLRSTYGSFGQARVVGIAAPEESDEDTFAAVSLRETAGFGKNRAGLSGSLNAQYSVDLGPRDHLRALVTGYGARSSFAGVVRQDDVDAGRIGLYDAYPYFASGQGVQSARVIVGVSLEHEASKGARFEFAPWFMWTDFRARQNFAGNIESSQIDPTLSGLGDLFETKNREAASGLTARFRMASYRMGAVEVVGEPGLYLRLGHTRQSKNLLNPDNLQPWDRRIDARIDSLDAGAYVDIDVRVAKKLRLSGGPRVDLLWVSIDDRLANLVPLGAVPPAALPGNERTAVGALVGMHATLEYAVSPSFAPAISYGEGFRSLDAERLPEGARPYSRVRSIEAGLRASVLDQRVTTRVAAFETRVDNELVFEATSGGLETQNASVRRGFVGSLVAKPVDWLLASLAFSATDAVFATRVPGVSHFVPNVPPILFRGDVTARGTIVWIHGIPLTGRIGMGYTLLTGRHLTDRLIGPSQHVVNVGAALRYGRIETGIDVYNALDSRYADDEQVFVSNWSFRPGQQPASVATHMTAAPPRTLLATAALYF
jgi:iron complex outermembrane receptor protein